MRLLLLLYLFLCAGLACAQQTDVIVYGATPAGIAAALAAAADGEKVLLVERTDRVGGMITNGLSHPDFRSFEGLSGTFLALNRRTLDFYRPEFGAETEKVSFRGTHAEPKVTLELLEKMLAEQPRITVQRNWELEAVAASSDANAAGDGAGAMRALEVCLFADERGQRHSIPARFFIDATYEGDLMAAAGVAYHVGREARTEFGEKLAPEWADAELQAYNFRFCMTREPENRVAVRQPKDYDREQFAGLLPLIENKTITSAFGGTPVSIFKTQLPLPHGKMDINDMSKGPVRLSMPGVNLAWPDGSGGVAIRDGATPALDAPPFSRVQLARTRQGIVDAQLTWALGLLYFVQHDPAVPEDFRKEASEWGWCRDEFRENAWIPEQLYVREARRLQGLHVFTENDAAHEPGDARAVLHADAIAMGDYGPNCHGTAHEGPPFGGEHTGEFYKVVPPYQIPYGVLVPRNVENLLVACAASSSHVGFCMLRYEPIWTSLGEAAGHAVHLAREKKVTVQKVPVATLQTRLRREKSATIYFSDVPVDSPDFAPAQWWGTLGGFHGIEKTPPDANLRGAKIIGQYYEAFPGHAAQLALPLDPELAARWKKLALEIGVAAPEGKATRGEWIRAAWKAAGEP
jgi:hypothetical protein